MPTEEETYQRWIGSLRDGWPWLPGQRVWGWGGASPSRWRSWCGHRAQSRHLNAGGAWLPGDITEADPEAFREVVEAEAFGAFLCTRACLPLMRQHAWGRIVSMGAYDAGIWANGPLSPSTEMIGDCPGRFSLPDFWGHCANGLPNSEKALELREVMRPL